MSPRLALRRGLRTTGSHAALSTIGALWLVLMERLLLAATVGESTALSGAAFAALVGWHALVLFVLFGLAVLVRGAGRVWSQLAPSRLAATEIGVALGVMVAAVPPAWALGSSLTSGEWIAMQSYVGALRAGFPIVLGPAAGAFAWVTCRLYEGPTRRRAALAGGTFLAASVGIAATDHIVMPGLYPAFHLAAYLAAAICTALGLHGLLPELPSLRWRVVPAIAIWIAAVSSLGVMSAATRAELMLRSPVAATLIRALFPPSPSSYIYQELVAIEAETSEEAPPPAANPADLGLPPDCNVILIVVDALRNDVVPPYRHLRVETPFLRKWSRQAFRFTRAYAQATRTHRSMPAMFGSVEASETSRGLPLPEYLAQADRTSAAVVNNFFIEPRYTAAQRLLEGFEYVDVYHKTEMDTMVDRALDVIRRIQDRPFFLWFHVYNMHAPGFDAELLSASEGTPRSRYKRSLGWLDGELKRFLEGLDDETRRKTVIILSADHGEGLGDNRVSQHGPTVFEEEVRIPLLIQIPGRRGRQIKSVVGNIDVVPTIAELFGLPKNQLHRGSSLTPLLLDPNAEWSRSYYMENKDALVVGLVEGDSKIIYDVKADIFHLFDVVVDPREEVDRWGSDPARDSRLRSMLVRRNPSPFRAELENPHTQALLVRNLENSASSRLDDSLRFLVRLAALQPNRPLVDAALRLFDTTTDLDTHLFVVSELFDADPGRWGDALVRKLRAIEGAPAEIEFVRGLAAQGQPPFEPAFVADRLTWWREHGSADDVAAWLALLRHWRDFSDRRFFPVLESILAESAGELGEEALGLRELALETLVAFEPSSGETADRIEGHAQRLLDDPAPLVQVWATRLLGHLRAEDSVPKLSTIARDADRGVRVRQAALHAVVAIRAEEAVSFVIELGEDPMLTVDAIRILRGLGSEEGLPFLRDVAQNHRNSLIRKRATRAIESIEGRR